jgi:hypothetical protein
MENILDSLTFEEFVQPAMEDRPRYNNFVLYFVDLPANTYREKEHFLRFQEENPALEDGLTKILTVWRDTHEERYRKKMEPRLHRAYKTMRSYGVSDEELFS